MSEVRISVGTLCAFAAIAFVVACVAHEAIGHGGACLVSDGQVTLVTSVYSRCSHSLPFIDAAGPAMNLAFATGAALALRWKHTPPSAIVFLALVLAFNGFWGAGYFIFSGVSDTGDWAFVLRNLLSFT